MYSPLNQCKGTTFCRGEAKKVAFYFVEFKKCITFALAKDKRAFSEGLDRKSLCSSEHTVPEGWVSG